jgi:hypothetical protein
VAGLRLVADTLEFLTADGNPQLRMSPPVVLSKRGRIPVQVSLVGCASDSSPAGPWGRPVTAPGAERCRVHLQWDLASEGYPALLDPAWTTTGDLGTARFAHAMVQLPAQGRMLTCGGQDLTAAPLASCELFNPVTGTWAATNPMPRVRTNFAMAYSVPTVVALALGAAGPRVVAVGGDGTAAAVAAIDVYEPGSGTWTFGTNLPFGRSFLTATSLPNDPNVIVILGGQFDGGGCADRSDNIVRYSFSLNTAGLVGNMSFKRALHQATAITTGANAGSILVTGGLGTCCGGCTGGVIQGELINATGTAATQVGAMLRAGRQFAATFALPSGQVRIAGGLIDTSTNQTWADSELYTPGGGFGDLKTFPGSAQCGGWGAFGILQNGHLLVAGGGDSAVANLSTARTFIYDGTSWSADGGLSVARRGLATGNTPGGSVMAVGGADTGPFVVFKRTELFDLLPTGAVCSGNGLCQSQQCIDGVCCNTACGGNCDACNLAGTVGTCTLMPSTVVCRPAASGCDLPENCTGTTATCPSDAFALPNTTCRASSGPCDPPEICVGGTPNCPADVLSPNTVVCRPDAGACDVAERCDGVSGACPADTFLAGVTCRPSAGVCDVGEACSGAAAFCPTDTFNSGSTCRAANGACDVAEVCNGLIASCPADAVAPATTQCRGAAGTCDLAENCSGSSTSCGPDVLAPQGTVCNQGFLCSGMDAGCPTACTMDVQCATGARCIGNVCVLQVGPGSPCTQDVQCTTTFCADGVCCNSACTEACATCNLANSVGTCSPVAVANPGDPSCSPYVCDGTSRLCPGSCSNSLQCATGFNCVAGACVPVKPNAAACTADSQCASGFCTDGVCCNSRCAGGCQACDVAGAVGTCTLAGRGEVGTPSCAPFVCDGKSADCPAACEADADCGPPAFCESKVCSSRTRGHVGFGCAGCSAVDGASMFGLLGVAMVLRRRSRGGGR